MDSKDVARFWANVDKGEACWRWKQRLTWRGYGQFVLNGRYPYAHRISYELAGKVIPPGWVIDHLCRNTWCVNPDHLEAVTQRENTRRGLAAKPGKQRGKRGPNRGWLATETHCGGGHEWNDRTLYVDPKGQRHCRLCHNARKRIAYQLWAKRAAKSA